MNDYMRQVIKNCMERQYSTKEVPLWKERFGWACVISCSELWGGLPIEINQMIINQLVETHYKCMDCQKYFRASCQGGLCKDCWKRMDEISKEILDYRIVDYLRGPPPE